MPDHGDARGVEERGLRRDPVQDPARAPGPDGEAAPFVARPVEALHLAEGGERAARVAVPHVGRHVVDVEADRRVAAPQERLDRPDRRVGAQRPDVFLERMQRDEDERGDGPVRARDVGGERERPGAVFPAVVAAHAAAEGRAAEDWGVVLLERAGIVGDLGEGKLRRALDRAEAVALTLEQVAQLGSARGDPGFAGLVRAKQRGDVAGFGAGVH